MTDDLTLQQLMDTAVARHGMSVRKLADYARERGRWKATHTTLNAIRSGTYKSVPTDETLRAIAWLAGVDDEVAYRAAGLRVPGPPFADELPPGVDYLSPKARKAVIEILRVLVDQEAGEEHARSAPTKHARESRAASEDARELDAQHALAERAERRFRAAAEKIQPGLADRIRQAAEAEPPLAGRFEPANVLDLDVPQTGQAAAALLRKMGPLVAAARDLSVLNRPGTTTTAAGMAADRILNVVEAQSEWAREIELAIEEQDYKADLAREKRGRAPLRAVAFDTPDDLDAEVEGQQQEP